ncbi:hypothetical protein SSX86_002051 [Deinandra increscens subsp. villosa]|uniref:Uncharacterized protein n=1 Tax=Deinandra increscens subsp. villosa TaxID=3103831 RepID=A0AAP0DVJ2_9ASTR
MASIVINAAMYKACSSPHLATKEPSQLGTTRSLGSKQESTVLGLNIEGKSGLITPQEQDHQSKGVENRDGIETSSARFVDERWKLGTWDLNMFVRSGKMDWDALIVAGRAAMTGFFMAYLVDVLTGLDVVGQSGNFICKIGLFMAVIGVVVFRQTESLNDLKNLADEATFYDKQWQASWQDQDSRGNDTLEGRMKQLYHQLMKLLNVVG